MDYQLPDKFDLIIVGTGMIESILSAAASRLGKTVLHLDRNDYYGGQWASFSLDALQQLPQSQQQYIEGNVEKKVTNNEFNYFGNNMFNIENFSVTWNIPKVSKTDENTNECENQVDTTVNREIRKPDQKKQDWDQEKLLNISRKFNIDLVPKLQYARGDLVELLISSNIARYSEYRSVSRVLVWLNGNLEVVPCSRSDVFSNDKVSVIEKRMLMKLLTSLDEEDEEVLKYENRTFKDFLKDKKLTPNLVHYVLYAIAMSNDETPFKEGIKNTKRFLNSLGRFGKTPFLFSMYGSGDITQAFCRLSAVFGGIYALNQPISGFTVSGNKFESVTVHNQTISAEHLVTSIQYSPERYVKTFKIQYISRGVLVTDRSVLKSENEHLTLLLYPPENGKNSATLIELGHLTGTCPKDLYIVHLIMRQQNSPEEDFQHIVKNLFSIDSQEEDKPNILVSFYFSLPDSNNLAIEDIPQNIFFCPGADLDLDYDLSIKKAQEIFDTIYPESEFLPRAPDPEEIVIEGEDQEN